MARLLQNRRVASHRSGTTINSGELITIPSLADSASWQSYADGAAVPEPDDD